MESSKEQQEAARKSMIDMIEQYFPSGILPDPYKGKIIRDISGRELEEMYKDIFHVDTDQWHFTKDN